MNCKILKTMLKIPLLASLAVVLSAGSSLAVELAAVPMNWTAPDGTVVAMWGFITVPDAAAYNCGDPVGTWDVGPVIRETAGNSLTINLKNCLPESTSVFIPGQLKTTTPVMFTPAGETRARVRSFDTEVGSNATQSYTWTGLQAGTYLYQSGTFVAKQVPKGLYGVLVVDVGAGEAYPGITYAEDEVLVYSEIDPDLNNGAYGVDVGARVNNYNPRYYLINGETYPNTGSIDLPGNTGSIGVGADTNVLLRFVNAGLQTYVPTLQGMHMSVLAEDGKPWPAALDQVQLELTAAKTRDAMINAGAGRYALYDRSLHLSEGSANGGMLVFIEPGTGAVNNPPVANPDTYSVPEGGQLVVAAPGVLDNDTDADVGDTLTAFQTGTLPAGALVLNTDGSFTYTPAGAGGAVETFQYFASDGTANSLPATVTINVSFAPIAYNDTFTVPRNIATPIPIADIIANDVDPDVGGGIDAATLVLQSATTTRGATVAVVGTDVVYTPEGGGGPDDFQYTVDDVTGATSNVATVRVRRVGASAAPLAAPASSDDGRGRTKSR